MENNFERLIELIEKVPVSSTGNKNMTKLLYTSLKTLYKGGMPKDIQVVDGKVNWNGMEFYISPNGNLDFDDKIYIVPIEESPIRIIYDYETNNKDY